jgi:translocation and assembly module TamA
MTLARAGTALLPDIGAALLLAAVVLGGAGCASVKTMFGSRPGEGVAAATAAAATGSSASTRSTSAAAAAAAAASAPASGFALVTPQEHEQVSPTLGVTVEIEAPGALRALLERHLDLVRLTRPGSEVRRDDIDDTEWARLIDAAPAQVRELLQTEGYFAPRVTIERAPRRAYNEPDHVKLGVEPGPRTQVSRLTLEVQGDLERAAAAGDAYAAGVIAQLQAAWPLPPGSDFRNADWSDAKAATLARLRAAGYANATWAGTGAAVDAEAHRVRLFLVADSGPLFRFGEMQIEGLVVHDVATVRHIADTSAGVPVTETLLLDFQERLQKAGLFENVSVTLDADPARADHARVLVRLTEAPLQVYTFGVGISANTGPRASVEHTWRRVFGRAVSGRNKIEWGEKRQFWEGELATHARPGLYRNLLGGTIENLESTSDTVLSQRLRLGRAQDTQRIERLYFVEAERSRRDIVSPSPGSTGRINAVALSINYHGTWRDLDSIVLPTQGFTFAGEIGLGQARGTDAPTGTFGRAYGRLTGYLPFGRAWYGQARLEAGQVFLKPGMIVPESQKWRAGGDDSVRGYGYRSLGPIVNGALGSGTALYTASVEVARPIVDSLPSLWGAVFVDAGNAANSFTELKPAVGLGVGLRWRSPVGPLRIDWAWGRETRQGRLHFSVGIAF